MKDEMSTVDRGAASEHEVGVEGQVGVEGRRSAITKLAVGGAALWAAPVVLASPASAQASAPTDTTLPPPLVCIPGTVGWSDLYPTSVEIPAGDFPLHWDAVPGLQIQLTDGDPDGTYSADSGVGTFFGRPGVDRSFRLQMDGEGAGPLTLTLVFAVAVTDVRFTVYDIDWAGQEGWQDEVLVSAQGSTGALAVQATKVDPAGSVQVAGDGSALVTALGTTNVGNSNSTSGDVDYHIAGEVTSVTITYQRARAVESQGVGLSDITWGCPAQP